MSKNKDKSGACFALTMSSYATKEGACLKDVGEVGMGRGAGPLRPLPPQRRPVSSTYTPSEPVDWDVEEQRPLIFKQQRRLVPTEMQLILPKPQAPEIEIEPWDFEAAEILETQEGGENDDEMNQIVEDFYANLTQELIKKSLDQVDAATLLPMELSNKEYLGEGNFSVQDDQNNEEIGDEFDEAEWSDAEDYGYSTKFPYKKKKPLVNKGGTLPKYVTPAEETEPRPEDDLELEPFEIEEIKEGTTRWSLEDPKNADGRKASRKSKDDPQKPRGSKPLESEEAALLRKSKDDGKGPAPSEEEKAEEEEELPLGEEGMLAFAYVYAGESAMDTNVETSIWQAPDEMLGEDWIAPLTYDKATQVTSDDIAEEYERIEEEERAAEEAEAFRLRRVPSLRADAECLVRPVGYKQLELSVPLEAVTLEATTQVTEQIMDEEWAMERGVFLSKDDILWPTVAEFELENVARRLYDYIGQCWKLDPKWMFYIHPVQSFTDNLRKRVTFEAKFSVPTQQAPIPQATASVFFIFEMSHYALRDEVVKVHYVVEGTRFRHTPGSIPFQDKWLWSVIMDKVRLQRSLGF